MQILFDRGILFLQMLIFTLKALPIIEICIGIIALSRWQSKIMALLLSSIYIFFSAVIVYVSDDYLMQPIDCGCFGHDDYEWPVYLLLLRNMVIAVLLIIYSIKAFLEKNLMVLQSCR